MVGELVKLLKKRSINVSQDYLKVRIESHPDYPSLIALQDSVEELGIEAYVCRGTKEELKKESKPFLAHFNIGEGQVIYFENVAAAEQKIKDFDKYWSGNVMFAEPTKDYGNAEHDKQRKKEKQIRMFGIGAIILSVSALLGLSIATGSISLIVLVISNLIGLYFSWLIAQKEFGISNSVSDMICSMAKHSRCESVLFSKGAKLFSWLTWGDIGIVYFSTSVLYLAIILFTGNFNGLPIFYLISMAGLIFPIYSLYYQWKVVKQWCMLCIGVLAALAISGIVSVIGLYLPIASESLFQFIPLFVFLLAVTLAVWQLLKSLYQKSLSSLTNEIKATSLKRNPEIFDALLQRQEVNNINLPEKDEAIQFGNPTAPYHLVIACNPYCGPCAIVHKEIERMFEKYPDQISVSVRFALRKDDNTNSSVLIVKEIVKVAKNYPFESVRDWYNLFDIDKYKEKYQISAEYKGNEITKFILWSKNAKIRVTPTVFINGRKVPDLYFGLDLFGVLESKIIN